MPARGYVRRRGVSGKGSVSHSVVGADFLGGGFWDPAYRAGSQRSIFGYFLMFFFILGFRRRFLALALTSCWLVFQGWKLFCNPVFIGLDNVSKLVGVLLIANLLVVTPPTSPQFRYHCS